MHDGSFNFLFIPNILLINKESTVNIHTIPRCRSHNSKFELFLIEHQILKNIQFLLRLYSLQYRKYTRIIDNRLLPEWPFRGEKAIEVSSWIGHTSLDFYLIQRASTS